MRPNQEREHTEHKSMQDTEEQKVRHLTNWYFEVFANTCLLDFHDLVGLD